MSYYLPFDPRHETVAFLAAHLAGQPGITAMAENLACHARIAARIAAEKLYAEGYRTTTLADVTLMHRPPAQQVGPLDDDDPGGGCRADVAA